MSLLFQFNFVFITELSSFLNYITCFPLEVSGLLSLVIDKCYATASNYCFTFQNNYFSAGVNSTLIILFLNILRIFVWRVGWLWKVKFLCVNLNFKISVVCIITIILIKDNNILLSFKNLKFPPELTKLSPFIYTNNFFFGTWLPLIYWFHLIIPFIYLYFDVTNF